MVPCVPGIAGSWVKAVLGAKDINCAASPTHGVLKHLSQAQC